MKEFLFMSQEKRTIPIGVADFIEMRKNNYCYIDKSLFIKEILNSGSQVSLFTRPRRFGKTMNMSMLFSFLNCHGPLAKTYFEGLNIAKEQQICSKHMNQYPVFFVTLKNLACQNMADFYFDFARRMAQELQKFRYLLDAQTTSPEEKAWFASLLSGEAKSGELKISIQLLTTLLHKHHGVKPWILIDEYDAPIHSAFQHEQYSECILFMKDLYSNALKDNSSLNKAVLTGILRVAKESIFSGLNNTEILSVVSPDYSNYFGITENELKSLLQEYELEQEFPKVKNWYNGYHFGDFSQLYNPWSILNWLKSKSHQFQPYWVNTSNNDLVKTLFFEHKDKLQEDIFKILSGENIQIRLSEDLHFPSLKAHCSSEDYFTLLLHAGYLTIKTRDEDEFYTLTIPNQEIQSIFRKMLGDWLNQYAPNLVKSKLKKKNMH